MVRFSVVRFSNGPFWLWDETSCSVDTDSHKLKQLKVKIVIIICQTSNQSATMEQNYCSSKSIFRHCATGNVDRSYF
jgi:hypothetical protein